MVQFRGINNIWTFKMRKLFLAILLIFSCNVYSQDFTITTYSASSAKFYIDDDGDVQSYSSTDYYNKVYVWRFNTNFEAKTGIISASSGAQFIITDIYVSTDEDKARHILYSCIRDKTTEKVKILVILDEPLRGVAMYNYDLGVVLYTRE